MHRTWIFKLIGLALLLVINLPLAAQEATQDPTIPEELYSQSARVFFPHFIYFDIVIDAPATDITALILVIQQEGEDDVVVELNANDGLITDPFTELRYIWDIPVDRLPALFEDLTYRWRAVIGGERRIDFTDTVTFTDHRVRWVQDEDPAGRLDVTMPINGPDPADLRQGFARLYDLLEDQVGPREAINLLLFPETLLPGCDRNDEGQPVLYVPGQNEILEAECDLDLALRIYRQNGYTVLNDTRQLDLAETLQTLVFDTFFADAWDAANVPVWFREGFKQFAELKTGANSLSISQQSVRSGRVYTLDELQTRPETPALRASWDAQSYGLVVYTARLIGVDGLFDLAANPGEDFTATYERAVGQPLELVLRNWQDWVFTRGAASDYAYSPYVVDTPTPTSTPSITPIPPTNTPTVTPTPTVTGVLSPTPTDTFTPTNTPIPPTATFTPRPPVSFVIGQATPTPTPAPPPTEMASPLSLGIVGVILVLVAVGALLLIRRATR